MDTKKSPERKPTILQWVTPAYLGLMAAQLVLALDWFQSLRLAARYFLYPLLVIPPTVLLFTAAFQTAKKDKRLSLAWYAFAAHMLAYAIGDILWGILDTSRGVSLITDYFFLAAYLLFMVGVLLVPHKKVSLPGIVKRILDVSTITLAFLFIFWGLVIGPRTSTEINQGLAVKWVSVFYPLGDVLMIWALARLIYAHTDRQDRRPLILMAIGAFFYAITDCIYGYQRLNGTFVNSGIVYSGWVLGYLMFLCAAILQIRWVSQQDYPDGLSSPLLNHLDRIERWAPYFPYLFALTPFFLILWKPRLSIPISPFALALISSGVIALVFIRQAISIWEISKLNRSLNDALGLVQEKSSALEITNQHLEREIVENQQTRKQLLYLAMHDSLTGLPNRAYLLEKLRRLVEFSRKYPGAQYAVLYLDCDQFKYINDSQGHTIGDQLLIQIASRLESCVRSNDMVGRIGGDEFVILMCDNFNETGVVRVANRIVDVFSKPFVLVNGKKVNISVSIGIIDNIETYDQPEEILRDADIAMYHAKTGGRNRYEFFQKGMREKMEFQMEMEHDLLTALEKNEFELVYQPILELKTLQLVGFEALIRWNHPVRGQIGPMVFIPICEQTGLINEVGNWVLKEACTQMMKWRADYPACSQVSVHVNVSGNQLTSPAFLKQVKRTIEKTRMDPRALQLEITENVFIRNSSKVIQTFLSLKEIGVECAIDDFGSGYSSLKYLQNFPIRNIKIDRGFIQTVQPGKSPDVIRAILAMVHNLDIQLTAEGIETEYQLEELRRLGCHFGQGYLFARPLTVAGVREYLEKLS